MSLLLGAKQRNVTAMNLCIMKPGAVSRERFCLGNKKLIIESLDIYAFANSLFIFVS